MSSFYVTMVSTNKNTSFPDNHPGDFQIQLSHALDFRYHDWEVALTEFSYTGQSFANISLEHTMITVKAENRAFYDNDYVVTFDKTDDLTFKVKLQKLKESRQGVETLRAIDIKLPQHHYTWLTLKQALLDASRQYSEYIRIQI